MKRFYLAITLAAGLSILSLPLIRAGQLFQATPQEAADRAPVDAAANLKEAEGLAWRAAVLVQHPPHPVTVWQQARNKWRQAVRLLEAIPVTAPERAIAQQKLVVYRRNEAAIDRRLQQQRQAATHLEQAEGLAWQAAVLVQHPPHPLRVWQQAQRKWQRAIELLEAIPPGTANRVQGQEKLIVYRQNLAAVQQRAQTERQALATFTEIDQITTWLNERTNLVIRQETAHPLGLPFEDYTRLVQRMDQALAQLASATGGTKHPIYQDLVAVVDSYRFSASLWQDYRAFIKSTHYWLYDDYFDQLFPVELVSPAQIAKYDLRPTARGRKFSLRESMWHLWERARDRLRETEKKLDRDFQAAQK